MTEIENLLSFDFAPWLMGLFIIILGIDKIIFFIRKDKKDS